jgi:hypothetical protein
MVRRKIFQCTRSAHFQFHINLDKSARATSCHSTKLKRRIMVQLDVYFGTEHKDMQYGEEDSSW